MPQISLEKMCHRKCFSLQYLFLMQIALVSCCAVNSFLLVLDFSFLDGKQNSLPNMWKVILTYVPMEGRVLNSYVDGVLDSSCNTVPLPIYSIEVLL